MRVVTVVTNPRHPGLRRYLERSCQHHGVSLVPLRSNRPMSAGRGGSLREKDRCLEIYLESLADDELVLFSDGYDAMILAPADVIETRFAGLDAPVVVSAERVCWPRQPELMARIPEARTPYRFPNSGGFMGRAQDLRVLLDRISRQPTLEYAPRSNQACWVRQYAEDNHSMRVDDRCEIFCTLSPASIDRSRWPNLPAARADPAFIRAEADRIARELDASNGTLTLRETGTQPCHLHFNGHTQDAIELDPGPLRRVAPWL